MSLIDDFSLTPPTDLNHYQYNNQKTFEQQIEHSPSISPISSPIFTSSFNSLLRRNSLEKLLPLKTHQTTQGAQTEQDKIHNRQQKTNSSKSIYNSHLIESNAGHQVQHPFHLEHSQTSQFQSMTAIFQRQKIKIRDDTELEFWQS